jgi:hypothetical protein
MQERENLRWQHLISQIIITISHVWLASQVLIALFRMKLLEEPDFDL